MHEEQLESVTEDRVRPVDWFRCTASLALVAYLLSGQDAKAQSSVTLYGAIDAGLTYMHNVAGESTRLSMTTSNLSYNIFGFKGNEDLGGGVKAVFQLESFFSVANGELVRPDKIFGVQSWVGLTTPSFGTVTVGRQFDPLTDLVQQTQGDYRLGAVFTTPGDVDNADDIALFSNSVKWASPTWGGLNVEAMYSFGGVAGSVSSGQVYSGALAYVVGNLTAAAGYLHIDNGNPKFSTRGVSSADSLFNGSVNAAYASARAIDIARAGLAYVLGSVTVGGYYGYARYSVDGYSTFSSAERYQTVSTFANWQPSPDLSLQAGYTFTASGGDSSARYHQVAAGADYFFSKRTDVYCQLAYQRASGENGQGPAQAVIGSLVVDSGKSSQGLVTLGLRHKF
ncbi:MULTISPECIES: porin [Caballeronia]|uniref:porin n=1 Tax=Caballeronia TaxID=1827195 RepID=UPI001FD4FF32|nr:MULTISPECIES: porin [Caballeronia]MDR5799121.1 porin [Caballeronia sp. LZ001]